jgi:hypothetical protein
MWSKLDDALLDHPKLIAAGDYLGRDGQMLALGVYVAGLLWANKQVSDGFLPLAVVKQFRCAKPLKVAAALAVAELWEEVADGYRIHDFHDFNYSAKEVNARRQAERDRRKKHGSVGGHHVRHTSGRT